MRLKALLLLAALGTAMRLGLVWSGACDAYVVADDAYYYFVIARNVALGLGATFDGLAPTNGFHPLWLLALVPLWRQGFGLPADLWVPIHLALTLCAALDLVTGLLLYRLLTTIGMPRAAPWACGIWFLSPAPLLLTLRGLEASLSALLVLLAFLLAIHALDRGRPSLRLLVVLGGAFGLAGLARTDNWPFLGCALAAMTIAAAWRHRWSWSAALRVPLVAGGVGALLAMPWFLWSWKVVGTPWQVSGAAKLVNPHIFGHLAETATRVHLPPIVISLVRPGLVPLRFVLGEEFTPSRLAWLVGAVLAASLLLSLVALRGLPRWSFAARLLVLGGVVFLLAHAFVYSFVFHSYVPWYALFPVLALAAWLGIAAAELMPPERSGWVARAATATALALAGLVYTRFFALHPIVPRGEEKVAAAILAPIAERHPEPLTIGAFDAGALGYFAPRYGPYRVVNLDCLVNNRAYEAWRRGEYATYLSRSVDLFWQADEDELDAWVTPAERSLVLAEFPKWPGREIYGPRAKVPPPR